MSLTSFIKASDVSAKLKTIRPRFPRKIPSPLRAEPITKRFAMVGTAFDYLLRFELQRRAPWAAVQAWVAEHVPDMIWSEKGFLCLEKDGQGNISLSKTGDEQLAKETAGRARRVVENAKAALASYVTIKSPSPSDLAAHAIRLAKLDEMYRAHQLNLTFEDADPDDVEDLLALLAIVPCEALTNDKVFLLNPTFGQTSLLVGGADVDLITGNMIVDIKTTKQPEMDAGDLDQLLGYFFLARQQRKVDPGFPSIDRLAIYFSRHGYFWPIEAACWTDHPQFSEVEAWFFEHAKKVFGSSEREMPKILSASARK
jgi:hypothetical protein